MDHFFLPLNYAWSMTTQKMREEYARIIKEKHQMELENLVRSRNEITINVNANRVFEQYHSSVLFRLPVKKGRFASVLDSLGRTEIMELYMKNLFQVRTHLQ